MPELSDLLHGAAPPPAPYDEDDVRRRVHRRRRMRRSLAGVAVVLACVAATGVVLALRDTDDDVAVTSRPTTTSAPATGSARGATTVAIVADEIWIGGDGYVSLGDGSRRLSMPGQVEELATGPDLTLWVRGRNFVAAVDTGAADSHPAGTPPPAGVLGTWSGAATDLVPLPSREVAITSASSDEVVIAKTSAIAELEEVWRIPVRGAPTDIVRTTRGEVWVRCGDGISELDVGAQGVTRTEQWSGRLLAPSLSGGIWTTEGDRLVDLTPANLSQGLSVAEGARHEVDATIVVETSYGVYVAGPAGVTRFSSGSDGPQVLYRAPSPADAPTALAASGGQVVYVVGGAVREGMATQASVDPEAWRREPNQVAARFLSDELHWAELTVERADEHTVHATSGSSRRCGRSSTATRRWRCRSPPTTSTSPSTTASRASRRS